MTDEEIAVLDVRGLACPMPLLKTKLALNRMAKGQRLRVLATDAGSARDIPAFLALGSHQLLESSREGDEFRFVIQRGD